MGDMMKAHKSKSLIPILGRPSLAYVLDALRHIGCSKCILCIDRPELYEDVTRIGADSGLPFDVFRDSGRGPTSVALEATSQVSSSHFLMLHGHQIVFPDHLDRLMAMDLDFVATTYRDSSEGVRKVATLDPTGRCLRLRRGSAEDPAADRELYLDKPYILETDTLRASLDPDFALDPDSPVDPDLRPDTIMRYARNLHAVSATFRHEYHYQSELPEVTRTAQLLRQRFSSQRQ